LLTAAGTDALWFAGNAAAPPGPPALAAWMADQRFVSQMHLDLLQRSVDPGALAAWSKMLQQGTPRADFVRAVEGSGEYQSRQVWQLYQRLLHRPAADGEVAAWLAFLGRGTGIDAVEAGILASPEYFAGHGGTPDAFVRALYHDVLSRDTDPAGAGYWVGVIAQDGSSASVANAVVHSPEAYAQVVRELFAQFLHRTPDDAGLQWFVGAMERGVSSEQILVGIVGSEEYFSRVAITVVNDLQLRAERYGRVAAQLFEQFVQRPPSADEAGTWTGRFIRAAEAGQRQQGVVVSLLNSAESLQAQVARWLQHYLGRTDTVEQLKSSAEIAPYVAALQAGDDFSAVPAGIVAGDEFYALAGGTDEGFVRRLFETAYDRAPSDAEVADWLGRLTAETRQQLAQEFLRTDEALRTRVAHWYQDYLGRTDPIADLKAAAEIVPWEARLRNYRDDFAVLAELLSSEAYFGFSPGLYERVGFEWSPPPGPFAAPVVAQRGAPATFRTGDPVVTTTYFYWYDAASGAHVVNPDGSDALTDHPPTPDGFSYRSTDWHAEQLRDMAAAGIDVVLPDYWGSPFSDRPVTAPGLHPDILQSIIASDLGLPRLVEARDRLVAEGLDPPCIGLFYDTSTLAGWNPLRYAADLRTPEGQRWFYETIRDFFSQVPARDWACVDGKPIVFIYDLDFAPGVAESLFPAVRAMFFRDFGTDLFLVNNQRRQLLDLRSGPDVDPWVDLLKQGTGFLPALGRFLASDAVAAGDDGFVQGLYGRLLGRGAEAGAEGFWVRTLQANSRESVANAFVNSDEFLRRLVAGWYRAYLRRPGSLAELAASPEVADSVQRMWWESPLAVLGDLLGGDEFFALSGGTADAWIDNLYQQVLLRSADPEGKLAWIRALARLPRSAVATLLLTSEEGYHTLAARWLYDYAGRSAPGEADATFTWGAARSPQYDAVAGIGPGYDDTAVRGPLSTQVPRDDGDRYRRAWESVLARSVRPWMVHVETWNEYHEATEIAASREYGRLYIDLTREYADRFHAGRA
jgi:hypothetical protein